MTASPHPPSAVPLGDSRLQSRTLESVTAAKAYHDWLTSLAVPHLGDDPLELGSGLGDYCQSWLDRGAPRFTVSEIDAGRLAHLRSRFAGDPRVQVRYLDVFDTPEARHSALVAFNVLEHIPGDVGALRAAQHLVRPGGTVVLFVPAFQFAMSQFDRSVGHVRRYTRRTLRQAMDAAGLEVTEVRYVNAPGLIAWFVGMRLLKLTPGDGPLLRIWDRLVVPAARRLEGRLPPPFGQSIFAVARVPAT